MGAAVQQVFPVNADPSAGDRRIWAITAYTLSALSGLLLLLTFVMIRRVKVLKGLASLKPLILLCRWPVDLLQEQRPKFLIVLHMCLLSVSAVLLP